MPTDKENQPESGPRDVTDSDRATAEAAVGPVSRWAIHRHLYDWMLSLAHRRYAAAALFTLSFAESSFFPVPPDVMLLPMCMRRRERAFHYATICSIASVLGGMLGYAIGVFLWGIVGNFFLTYVFSAETFDKVKAMYDAYDFWIVFAAGFTPLPYKVFTIAGGVFGINFPMFVIASILSRSARFYIEAWLAWKFGASVEKLIDRYFNLACVALLALGLGGFLAIKYFRHGT